MFQDPLTIVRNAVGNLTVAEDDYAKITCNLRGRTGSVSVYGVDRAYAQTWISHGTDADALAAQALADSNFQVNTGVTPSGSGKGRKLRSVFGVSFQIVDSETGLVAPYQCYTVLAGSDYGPNAYACRNNALQWHLGSLTTANRMKMANGEF